MGKHCTMNGHCFTSQRETLIYSLSLSFFSHSTNNLNWMTDSFLFIFVALHGREFVFVTVMAARLTRLLCVLICFILSVIVYYHFAGHKCLGKISYAVKLYNSVTYWLFLLKLRFHVCEKGSVSFQIIQPTVYVCARLEWS